MALTPPVSDDQQGQKEYFDALTESLKVLENRRGPNLFNIAAGFFKPTRSGSFGESLGNAAEAAGADEERDQAKAPQIAQMRAALAGQKYEAQKTAQAYGLLANQMNLGSPEAAQQALQSGQGIFGLSQKFTPEFYVQLSRLSPKIADVVLKASGMDLERFKAMQEAMKNNMSLAQMMDRFSPAVVKKFYELQGMPMPSPSAQTAPTTSPNVPTTAPITAPEPKPYTGPAGGIPATVHPDDVRLQAIIDALRKETVVQTPAADASKPAVEYGFKPIGNNKYQLTPSGRVVTIDPTQSPEDQRKFIEAEVQVDRDLFKKREEGELESQREGRSKRGEPFQKKFETLAAYDYKTVQDYNLMNRELIQLVKDHPNTVGLLVRQGPVAAALQTAETGITTPFGQISAPVTEALSRLKLSPQEQAVARNIMQLVTQLNQRVMRDGKDIYGPQISVFDAREMSKPGFQTTDPASFITYLAMKNIVTNKFMGEMADAQTKYFRANRNASTSDFFSSENKAYTDIVDRLGATMRDLTKNSPFNK